ncbi:hypothetical protein [Micromonospora avicenniae]|uniref:hypothetical protein n=1 Tax=Micromonospora avicenniae TaxID=1198245 RepID=UPI003421E4BA
MSEVDKEPDAAEDRPGDGTPRKRPGLVILAVVAAALVICCCSAALGLIISWSAGLFHPSA